MSVPLPKLSYVLLSHNREKYIRAAIESAFAQDYEGELEYIFSDDCSTDRTFEIIKECVAAYKGNRRVVVTQTPKNLHLAGNTNHAVQFVESDWIVRADDDDISSVDRCTLIGQAIAAHPRARYITTGVAHFTDASESAIIRLSRVSRNELPNWRETDIHTDCLSSIAFNSRFLSYKAWHTDVFRIFGPLHLSGYYVDDLVCYYRASILGTGVHASNSVAVYMRDGSGNMSRGGDDNQRGYKAIIRREQFNDKYHNLTLGSMIELQNALIKYVDDNNIQQPCTLLQLLHKDIYERTLLSTYWRRGVMNRVKINKIMGTTGVFDMVRCLPLPIYAFLLAVYRKLAGKSK